jgi:hypothetical protein
MQRLQVADWQPAVDQIGVGLVREQAAMIAKSGEVSLQP